MILVPAFLVLISAPLLAQGESQKQPNSCISCHLEVGEEMALPVQGMENDVHAQNGLSCQDCHGGDPTAGFDGDMDAAMDPAKGYIGKPARQEIPQFCARCHSNPEFMRRFNPRVSTDQLDRYKTSIHGKRLADGDTKVATCTDCHGVHGIREVSDPRSPVYPTNLPETCGRCHSDAAYMEAYGIPTDQVELYKQSVHGKTLLEKGDEAAPACNDCHGNHGAAPPGLPSISYVCGQCHLNNSELFWQSPHNAAFKENDLPECETCHGNHDIQRATDEMLGTGESSICTDCHEEDSKGYQVAADIRADLDSLKWKIALADSIVKKAMRAGMEVSEAQFKINDAKENLIKSRTLVHSLVEEKVKQHTTEGMKRAEEAFQMGVAALKELQFRRKGLALSVIFIMLFAIGLYLKIREIDQRTLSESP